MKSIKIVNKTGTFAENKDVARELREKQILPLLKNPGEEIVLDFTDVTGATQSFVHALISEPIRQYGDDVFERLVFKNCSPTIQQVINTVAEYMQDT